ncbi:SDR family NAD(P)-dependent oxidoreductase [Paraburkholderia sp. JHI869]|uniref:SDR family NAD(P)-dependent oxidoreductase n=1 Tax=Paraburkholderia sp. JHI869 TaxID=3112959 RepID=UPI00316EF4BB
METIQNQTVLITGGSRGLGLAMVEALLRRQANVTALARDGEGLAAVEPQGVGPTALAEPDRSRLVRYVACFNARDFDTLRTMLAGDVQLDLVNRLRVKGRDKVGKYLHRYALAEQWRFEAARMDGRPVMVVFDRNDPAGGPAYFVALDFVGDAVTGIRDFLFARYVLDGAELRGLTRP